MIRCDEYTCHEALLLALVKKSQLVKVLEHLLDENKFLSPYGIRSLSKVIIFHFLTCVFVDSQQFCHAPIAKAGNRLLPGTWSHLRFPRDPDCPVWYSCVSTAGTVHHPEFCYILHIHSAPLLFHHL